MTQPYRLYTDSCCDLPHDIVERLGVSVLSFPYVMDGVEHLDDLGRSLSPRAFYDAMRGGSQPTTAQVPLPAYLDAFTAAAEAGEPIVFASFSSALSGTHGSALVARDAVLAEHPDAEIHVIDTRCASAVEGLVVHEAARKRDAGLSAGELAEWLTVSRTRAHGAFTLESLEHLRRGGRISDVAAVAGAMLDVRPVLRINAAGELVIDRAVRGRKKSVRAILDRFDELSDPGAATAIVAHGDAPDEAAALEDALRERTAAEIVRCDVGPVVGSHTGPGMLAVVFWGAERAS